MYESGSEILKFCASTECSLSNLEKGVIYCQHFSAYNDPFEFWNYVHEGIPDADSEPERFVAATRAWGMEGCSPQDKDLINYFDECQHYQPPFQEIRERMRIACFGSQRDNLLMWSHYADGLRGFCIVFDGESIAKAEPEGHLLDVAYLHAPPIVDSFVYAIACNQDWYHHTAIEETETRIRRLGKTEEQHWIPIYEQAGAEALGQMHQIRQLVFAAKPAEWKYEREQRLLVQTDGRDGHPIERPYPRKAVREIIFGERMSCEFRSRLMSVLHQHYSAVPIRTARRAQGRYTLSVD